MIEPLSINLKQAAQVGAAGIFTPTERREAASRGAVVGARFQTDWTSGRLESTQYLDGGAVLSRFLYTIIHDLSRRPYLFYYYKQAGSADLAPSSTEASSLPSPP